SIPVPRARPETNNWGRRCGHRKFAQLARPLRVTVALMIAAAVAGAALLALGVRTVHRRQLTATDSHHDQIKENPHRVRAFLVPYSQQLEFDEGAQQHLATYLLH